MDKSGHIVTNYHVVEGADEIRVSFSNRDTVEADLVGVDPSTDLAVLQVDASASALTPLPLGNSDKVQVGDPVVAIGNPFGLDRTATAGIVSAVQREISAPVGDFAIDHVIQTDAPINQGNSGGPLLNMRGQVIGVNTQIETGGVASGNVGIGFAVPSNTVKDVVAQILGPVASSTRTSGSGTNVVNDGARRRRTTSRFGAGVLVAEVRAGTGAEQARAPRRATPRSSSRADLHPRRRHHRRRERLERRHSAGASRRDRREEARRQGEAHRHP